MQYFGKPIIQNYVIIYISKTLGCPLQGQFVDWLLDNPLRDNVI